MAESIIQLMSDYHNFDDGLVMSFGFFYPTREPPAVQGTFYAKNHALPGDQWDTVTIVVRDIVEFHAQWRGNQANSICAGVHVVRFGDLWCLDVDGAYGSLEDPRSIDEVRQYGDCYAIGRGVDFHISENRNVDIFANIFSGGAG